MRPENAQESFKCSKCGNVFARNGKDVQECPVCGNSCSDKECTSFGASNEGY